MTAAGEEHVVDIVELVALCVKEVAAQKLGGLLIIRS